MREKYVEERFPRYFQFGESHDGLRVDLATSEDMTVCTVTREEAIKLQKHRDEAIDMLCVLALKLAEVAPEEFTKIWYP